MPFHEQPVQVRQQILLSWGASYLPLLRNLFRSFTTLFKAVWSKTSPAYFKVLGLPRAPVHGTPGQGHDFSFLQFPPGDGPETIETDVVIVGSGCGGSVSAKNLAEAGHKVIVTDRAFHYPPEYLPMSPADATIHLFRNGGAELSDDASIGTLAGQAWGGGGTVNWSASLQTQHFVRQEWADGGLPFFTSAEYQTCLDRVCKRMGVSTEHIEHNHTNRVLMEGARQLGYSVRAVPQNTGGKQHYCGYCSLGCGSAEKQGPVVSFLPDAGRAGAQFVEGFDAREVLFETQGDQKVATGVKGTWRSRDSNGGVNGSDFTTRTVIIKAKRVIVSCGPLSSPLLLQRSGLKNPQIGRNLHLHPVCCTFGVFPYPTKPWDGGILTAVVESFQDLDGKGHGSKLEALFMFPHVGLPFQPWTGGAAWKVFAAKFSHMAGLISLGRDRDSGRVYEGPDGATHIAYTPSAFDKAHVLEGVLGLARILYAQGAREIYSGVAGAEPFVRDDDDGSSSSGGAPAGEGEPDPGVNEPRFKAWLEGLRRRGMGETVLGSAHQMGTCRMGASERGSVVDPRGKVWGTEGLYVADASVFPSASGVNPMVTNMAISDWMSRGVAKELAKA